MATPQAFARAGDASLLPVRRPDAGWFFTLYPDAGEGGGCFRASDRPGPLGIVGPAADPERARAEAARRAQAKVRRYCAANRLDRLGTLTYDGDGCHDPRQARADVGVFFRRLRDRLGGARFPYLWVPEWHPGGHGLHLHYAMSRYVQRGDVVAAWDAAVTPGPSWAAGFVHIKRLGNLPHGADGLRSGRAAARYLSKYVTKTFDHDHERPTGLHRYEVAQGFQPRAVMFGARSSAQVVGQAARLMGSTPEVLWSSGEVPDWQGAPAIWSRWDRPPPAGWASPPDGSVS